MTFLLFHFLISSHRAFENHFALCNSAKMAYHVVFGQNEFTHCQLTQSDNKVSCINTDIQTVPNSFACEGIINVCYLLQALSARTSLA